jgi:predicted ester cyclase
MTRAPHADADADAADHAGAGDVLRAYADAIDAQDWAGLRALLADDFTCHLVRTGERLGADDYVDSNRDYPGRWAFRLEDVVACGDRVAGRARVTDGPVVFHVALLGSLAGPTLVALDEVWTEDRPAGTTRPTTTTGAVP